MKRALAIMYALVGCSFSDAGSQTANLCQSSAECGDASCVEGRCIAESIEPTLIALQVVPTSPGDDRPAWSNLPFELRGPTERDLRLPGTIEFRGTLRLGDERVGAELIFRRPGLPGQPETTLRASTFAEPRVSEGIEYDFSVQLEASQAYDLEVRPASGNREPDDPWFRVLPPLFVEDQLVTPELEEGRQGIWETELTYDAPEAPCTANQPASCMLSGSVVRLDGDTMIAEPGLTVRAIDSRGRIVSSTALTDDEGGFSLAVSAGVTDYILRVGGASGRDLFPVIDVDPRLLDEDVRIRVPAITSVVYEGAIETVDGTPMEASLEFASSNVVGLDEGIVGAFQTTAVTDASGRFSVTLLPGTYEVSITPSDLDFALTQETVRIGNTSGVLRGQVFSVLRRALLGGSVVASGEEVEGLSVEALSVDEVGQRTSGAVTDETGRFALPLDVGTYDLFMRPSSQTGFPWLVVPGLRVGQVDGTLAARYELRAPVPVTGRIEGAASGFEVRAFTQVEERFVEVGRARVNDLGEYELLLPSELVHP
ncbi:MAG: carboxypeptidase-like regulatory domain-containing protein [Myxococcota bacterium]